MKITKPDLAITNSLETTLHGLTKKHTRQMHQQVAHSVKKLTKSFARLLTKEQRAHDKQQRKATKASVKNLVLKLHEVLAQSVAQAVPARPAPPRSQPETLPDDP
jgi:hypothetical protein